MRISLSKCSAESRTFSADFRTFPADFRAFPAYFRAFPVSAFWLGKLQTRESCEEAVTCCPTAIGDELPETELSMTGPCKLQTVFMCIHVPHKRSQPAKSDFRQISSKVYIDVFSSACTEISVYWRVQVYTYIYILSIYIYICIHTSVTIQLHAETHTQTHMHTRTHTPLTLPSLEPCRIHCDNGPGIRGLGQPPRSKCVSTSVTSC